MQAGTVRPADALLDETLAVFLAEGFRHLTLAQMAARLRCSKSTLYRLGAGRDQLIANVLKHFFREATAAVEARVAAAEDPAERLAAYLGAVADRLRPASAAFMADVSAYPRAHEIYEENTAMAAARVAELIDEGVRTRRFRNVDAAFVADTIAATMRRIQAGQVRAATGLGDADAYDELASLVLDGIRRGKH
ncbi:MAG: TetR/AcrR family transcriptional regulator [Solirubrobacterales bacterium]